MAGLFGLGLGSQVGATIAGGQVLAISEGLAVFNHGQIDGSAITEDFGHGPPIAVFRLNLETDHRSDWQELLSTDIECPHQGLAITAEDRSLNWWHLEPDQPLPRFL